jgi:integrase
VAPKTRKSKRSIVVYEDVISVLKQHMDCQKKVKKQLGENYLDEGFIFAKKERQPGYPIFIKTVEDRMARLLKLAGVNKKLTPLTPHSIRHTHTSLLVSKAVRAHTVSFTANLYSIHCKGNALVERLSLILVD